MSNPSYFDASNHSGLVGAMCGLALSCCIHIVLEPNASHLALIVGNNVLINMSLMVSLVMFCFAFNSKVSLSLVWLLLCTVTSSINGYIPILPS